MASSTFFKTPAGFRAWLRRNHAKWPELWVGFHKKASGNPSITWPEAVDEALCFGWIDGVRKSVDETRYTIRFTPRRATSIWSAVNIGRARALIAAGRMQPAGLDALNRRTEQRSQTYSYEQRVVTLDAKYQRRLKANEDAWTFFQAQPPWYRRTSAWWIMSAKLEATRLRRLGVLILHSAKRQRIPPLTRPSREK